MYFTIFPFDSENDALDDIRIERYFCVILHDCTFEWLPVIFYQLWTIVTYFSTVLAVWIENHKVLSLIWNQFGQVNFSKSWNWLELVWWVEFQLNLKISLVHALLYDIKFNPVTSDNGKWSVTENFCDKISGVIWT